MKSIDSKLTNFALFTRTSYILSFSALFFLPSIGALTGHIHPVVAVFFAIPFAISILRFLKMPYRFTCDENGSVRFVGILSSVNATFDDFLAADYKPMSIPCPLIRLRTKNGTVLLSDKGYEPYSIDQLLFDARNKNKNYKNMPGSPLF
jgi:hypothetical protein